MDKHKFKSTDKLAALTQPPTKIENETMQLDPIKVVKAWADSADVLREVAAGVQSNLEDNDKTRELVLSAVKTVRNLTLFVIAIAIAMSVVVVFCMAKITKSVGAAETKIQTFLVRQQKNTEEIRAEARQTREEAVVVTSAVSSVLKASLAEKKGSAEHEQALKEAEAAVGAAGKGKE